MFWTQENVTCSHIAHDKNTEHRKRQKEKKKQEERSGNVLTYKFISAQSTHTLFQLHMYEVFCVHVSSDNRKSQILCGDTFTVSPTTELHIRY